MEPKNFSLVQQYKEAGTWDTMDAQLKQFATGLDAVLVKMATNKADASELTTAIDGVKAGMLNAEQVKSFGEMETSVKAMATEIQKLKDAGFEAYEVQSFPHALAKALNENKEAIANLKGNHKQELQFSFKAAAAMSTGNVSANTVSNMPGNPATVVPGIVGAPRNMPFILDFVDNGSMSTPTIQWFNKVNRENGTAIVAESGLKPLSDFDVHGETATARKIAHAFNVSEESLKDIPLLQSEIEGEGMDSLKLQIEDQILNGDGTGNNLKGITVYAGGYTLPALSNTVFRANEYDSILAINTMLETLNFKPNAAFVNPVTRFKLRTTKTDQGAYVIPPSADSNATNVDGLPIIAKNQIDAGSILIGDFKKSHVRFYMDITMRIGYSGDDFRYNKLTFIMEARLAHFVRDVETSAFVYDDLATIMADLESA